MTLNKNIIIHFLSPKRIFFLFILLDLIPNYLLFFTENAPLNIGIASLLISLSGSLFLYSCVKKPGIMRWILFPKFLADVFQLVLLYLFGNSIIAVDMFLSILTSNPGEAGELLSNIWPPIVGCILFYTPLFYFATLSIKQKETLSSSFRKKGFIAACILVTAGLFMGYYPNNKQKNIIIHEDVYPINIVYNAAFAINKSKKSYHHAENAKDFTFHATKLKKSCQREIVILVIGETSRAINWGLYGSSSPTTPRLDTTRNLIHFTDVLTQSNTTAKSVPIILSSACAENFNVLYNQKSVISAFKEAGFKTVTLSNQPPNHSFLDDFYAEADYYKNYNVENNTILLKKKPDGCVLPDIQKLIQESDEDLFIFVHTYGSHFNYKERYTKEFAKFQPDNLMALSERYEKEMLNAYNNSILYTDYVLNEIIQMLQKSNACASFLYLSDHGEDLFDDNRKRYLHSSPTPTFYQLYVPYILWFSDTFKELYPQKYQAAFANRQTPITSSTTFHSVLDLGDIETSYKDSTLSVTSRALQHKIRYYVNDHDKPIKFTDSGIKELDFNMLKKWNIDDTLETDSSTNP